MSDDSLGTLQIGGTRQGNITPTGNRDYFTLSLTQGVAYTFTAKADPPFAVDMGVSDQNGSHLGVTGSVHYSGLYVITEIRSFVAPYTGKFHLVIAARAGVPVTTGTYTAYAALAGGASPPGTTPTTYPDPVEQPDEPPPLPAQPEYFPYITAHTPVPDEPDEPDEPEFVEGIITGKVTNLRGQPLMATVRARRRDDKSLSGYSVSSKVNGEYAIYTPLIGVSHFVTANHGETKATTKDRVRPVRAPNNYNLDKGIPRQAYHTITSPAQLDRNVFSEDGSKMFCLYINGDSSSASRNVHEFALSTPFDVTTAVYVGYAIVTPPYQPTFATWHCLAFKPDGTKLFLFTGQNCFFYQYNLAIPWDISTITYANRSMGCQLGYQYTCNITFSPDGTKFQSSPLNHYASSAYHLVQHNLATPWTLPSTSTTPPREDPVYSFSPVSARDHEGLNGHIFTPQGEAIIYAAEEAGFNYLGRIELSTPWDLTTITSYQEYFLPGLEDYYYHPLLWRINGAELLMKSRGGSFTLIRLPEPYYLEGANMVCEDYKFLQTSYPGYADLYVYNDVSYGPFCFSPDGTKLITAGAYTASLTMFTLATPWDITTASMPTIFVDFYEADAIFPYGVTCIQAKPDGTVLYISTDYDEGIYEILLGIPWDITSVLPTEWNVNRMPGITQMVCGFGISDDGRTVGVITDYEFDGPGLGYPKYAGNFARELYADKVWSIALATYTLDTPWDIKTARLTGNHVVPPDPLIWRTYLTTNAAISSDGQWLFIQNPNVNDAFVYFHLPVPWDVTTAVYQTTRYPQFTSDEFYVPVFVNDGMRFFVMESYNIYQFEIEAA